MNLEYYVINAIYNCRNTYYLYYYPEDSDKDSLAMNGEILLRFESIEKIISYAKNNKMKLCEIDRISKYDINRLEYLISHLDDRLNCSEIIDFWNITDTICNSIKKDFIGNKKEYNFVYNELFGGCNTAVNAYEYHPSFDKNALISIKKVLKECFILFKEYII